MLNDLELTGRARTHVVQRDDLRAAIHAEALEPFLDMKADAARDGLELALTSAFRDFAAQQRIWDMKFRGERPLYDEHGNERDRSALSEEDMVDAILCWNALPGASRHHWGSDLDVIDRAAMPEGYRVRLTIDEYAPGGVFHRLTTWLDANAARYGFFRPYRTFRGGVRPEPWHLSYGPVAVPALAAMSLDLLADAVEGSDMLGRAIVRRRLGGLYDAYVANVDAPDAPIAA
jgi:LAS superfamily LD-carboxypeptidase LdcB